MDARTLGLIGSAVALLLGGCGGGGGGGGVAESAPVPVAESKFMGAVAASVAASADSQDPIEIEQDPVKRGEAESAGDPMPVS